VHYSCPRFSGGDGMYESSMVDGGWGGVGLPGEGTGR
jgi:hypothetical protein